MSWCRMASRVAGWQHTDQDGLRIMATVVYVWLDFGKTPKKINFTLGLFHFIGPASSYTHTLLMHNDIARFSWLVASYISSVSFSNHLKSWLRLWGPQRTLDGRYQSEISPSVSETSLRPSRLICTYSWHFFNSLLLL